MEKDNNIHQNIVDIQRYFYKKYKRSSNIFITLNIISFVLAAGLVILNLYAIRKNPSQDTITKVMFVATSILTGIGAMITALLSFFVFRKKALSSKEKAEAIGHEKDLHKHKGEPYNEKDRDQKLIDKVVKILND